MIDLTSIDQEIRLALKEAEKADSILRSWSQWRNDPEEVAKATGTNIWRAIVSISGRIMRMKIQISEYGDDEPKRSCLMYPNDVYCQVDRIVAGLEKREKRVVMAHYVECRRMRVDKKAYKCGMKIRTYERILNRIKRKISAGVDVYVLLDR